MKRYGAVLYEGHNRIDLGSYPNIMALLTGEETEVGFLFQNLDDGRLWVDELETKLISKVRHFPHGGRCWNGDLSGPGKTWIQKSPG